MVGEMATGHTFLQARAAQFADEHRRARFLEHLPAQRALLAASRARGEWATGDGPRLRSVWAESS
jgi:hypothetical protein